MFALPIEIDWRNRYGGKRAWLRHSAWRAAYGARLLDRFRYVRWDRVTRLVFVCKGNVCRSAYAHHRALQMGVPADSFGLDVGNASAADPRAIINAQTRGVELRQHAPKPIGRHEFRPGDLLSAMEPGQAIFLAKRFTHLQITLTGIWASETRPYLHDPFGHGDLYFQTCFSLIDSAVDRFIRHLA